MEDRDPEGLWRRRRDLVSWEWDLCFVSAASGAVQTDLGAIRCNQQSPPATHSKTGCVFWSRKGG